MAEKDILNELQALRQVEQARLEQEQKDSTETVEDRKKRLDKEAFGILVKEFKKNNKLEEDSQELTNKKFEELQKGPLAQLLKASHKNIQLQESILNMTKEQKLLALAKGIEENKAKVEAQRVFRREHPKGLFRALQASFFKKSIENSVNLANEFQKFQKNFQKVEKFFDSIQINLFKAMRFIADPVAIVQAVLGPLAFLLGNTFATIFGRIPAQLFGLLKKKPEAPEATKLPEVAAAAPKKTLTEERKDLFTTLKEAVAEGFKADMPLFAEVLSLEAFKKEIKKVGEEIPLFAESLEKTLTKIAAKKAPIELDKIEEQREKAAEGKQEEVRHSKLIEGILGLKKAFMESGPGQLLAIVVPFLITALPFILAGAALIAGLGWDNILTSIKTWVRFFTHPGEVLEEAKGVAEQIRKNFVAGVSGWVNDIMPFRSEEEKKKHRVEIAKYAGRIIPESIEPAHVVVDPVVKELLQAGLIDRQAIIQTIQGLIEENRQLNEVLLSADFSKKDKEKIIQRQESISEQMKILIEAGRAVPMQRGGLITHPLLASIAEMSPEAVIPLDRISDLIVQPAIATGLHMEALLMKNDRLKAAGQRPLVISPVTPIVNATRSAPTPVIAPLSMRNQENVLRRAMDRDFSGSRI